MASLNSILSTFAKTAKNLDTFIKETTSSISNKTKDVERINDDIAYLSKDKERAKEVLGKINAIIGTPSNNTESK